MPLTHLLKSNFFWSNCIKLNPMHETIDHRWSIKMRKCIRKFCFINWKLEMAGKIIFVQTVVTKTDLKNILCGVFFLTKVGSLRILEPIISKNNICILSIQRVFGILKNGWFFYMSFPQDWKFYSEKVSRTRKPILKFIQRKKCLVYGHDLNKF